MKSKNIKIKYTKNLDEKKDLLKQANLYDEAEIDDIADLKKAVYQKAKTKRITINIPDVIYIEAKKIGRLTGSGYQNVLKTAMAMGLHTLEKNL